MSGWHGSGGKHWLSDGIDYGLLRTYTNSIFAYFGSLNIGTGNDYAAGRNNSWQSRGVVIVGSGLLYIKKYSKIKKVEEKIKRGQNAKKR